jgi:hypothetical protein
MTLSTAQATLDLSLLHASANKTDFNDIAIDLAKRGTPLEVVTRLQGLWNNTQSIAGEIIAIGKIIVIKLWEFIKANPNMTIGIVLGAAIGALVNLIPWIGHFLAPIAMTVSAFLGGIAGHQLDKIAKGDYVSGSLFENLITAAKLFYQLFADIFIALKDYLLSEVR